MVLRKEGKYINDCEGKIAFGDKIGYDHVLERKDMTLSSLQLPLPKKESYLMLLVPCS